MRGANIVAMVVFHFFLPYRPTPMTDYANVVFAIGAFVAPAFLYLAGASVWFFLQWYPPTRLFKRGVFLLGLTVLISILIKARFYLEWTMIQDIGVAYIGMALLAFVTRYRFSAALVVYLIGAFAAWATNVLFVGEFPFLLYAPYFLMGYAYCAICPTNPVAASMRAVFLSVAMAVGLMGVGALAGNFARDGAAIFFADVLWRIGALTSFHFIAVYVLKNQRFDGRVGGALVLMGRISLTCYYIQQVTLRILQRIDFHPIVVTPEISHLMWIVLMLGLIWTILQIWKRFDYAFSLEWMMRRL